MVWPIISLALPCAVGLRRRSFRERSRGSAPSVLPMSRPALTRRCACRPARDHSCVRSDVRDSLFGPHTRLIGHKRVALYRVADQHDLVLLGCGKTIRAHFATTLGTSRRCSRFATCRLCPETHARKSERSRFVRSIGHPSPVRREGGVPLVEWGSQENLRLPGPKSRAVAL